MADTTFRIQTDASAWDRFSATLGKEVERLVASTTIAVQQTMQDSINHGPKTGRIYERGERAVSFVGRGKAATSAGYRFRQGVSFTARRGSTAKAHQASAPGEAPATDMGALASSIRGRRVSKYVGVVDIGGTLKYPKVLEMGSADGKIAPRPFVRPAVAKEKPIFDAGVAAAAKKSEKA